MAVWVDFLQHLCLYAAIQYLYLILLCLELLVYLQILINMVLLLKEHHWFYTEMLSKWLYKFECRNYLTFYYRYRHHQYTVTTDWPGGVYGSPTICGSRAGALIAVCWATLLNFGLDGYVQATRDIIHTTHYIEKGLLFFTFVY